MPTALARYGVPGAAGLLIGLVAVWWIAPTTNAGAALIIAICVCVAALLTALVRSALNRRR